MRKLATILVALTLIAVADSSSAIAQNYPRPQVMLQDVADGNLVTVGNKGYMVLSVTGETPTAGTKWALDVTRGEQLGTLKERSGAIRGGPAAFGSVKLTVSMSSSAVPTASISTGDMDIGMIAVKNADLWMKVRVYSGVDEDGAPVYTSPGAGKIWAIKLNGGTTVQKIDDDMVVTRIVGVFRSVSN